MMKDKKGGKIFTKFAAKKTKIYSYCMEKGHHEKEDREFIRGVKKWGKKVNK